ncbi:hypothetical protein QR680_014687 [Steinernema hermaphroditum]|uniref:Nuclear receptor domain-containing protein n=1 Tax=Steinernema hermaphroditum TaxID=289476 RepID=A0AA39ICE6_9BILA|nr:hypothetical protein QR680_014687 [Steinernema hermaphroditum]
MGPKRRRAFRKRGECTVCGMETTAQYLYGAQKRVCRSCGVAFMRHAKLNIQPECLKNPVQCEPGQVASRHQCRKCWVQRCFEIGMSYNDYVVHKSEEPEKAIKGLEIDKKSIVSLADFADNVTVGVHEEGENFFSMEKQFMLEESMHLHIYSLLSKLNLFKKFDPANLMELAQHLAPYTVWIILAYYVHRNGGGKIEKYNYNRNFILPHVYVDNTYYGIYVQVKNSLPWAPPIDWTNIATARMEVINSEEKLIQILKEYFFPNQSTFHLLMFLLFAELMVKRSRMKGDKQAQSKFEDLKNRILKEMETWYKSKNMSLQLMFAKVHDFLEFAEAQGQKVTDLRTFLKLHMDLYKMQNHGEEHLATHF